jgi:hypothetical protein
MMRCVIGPHWVPVDLGELGLAPPVLDVSGIDVEASQEAFVLESLAGRPLPALPCDTILNSDQPATRLVRVAPNEKLLMVFWTPACAPCKPLLAELATLSSRAQERNLSFLGVVQAADPEMDPPGDWRLQRVQGVIAQYKVGFPTCVHSSNEVTEAWHAGGVPLCLLVSDQGVERVVLGSKGALQLANEIVGPSSP